MTRRARATAVVAAVLIHVPSGDERYVPATTYRGVIIIGAVSGR